MFYGLIIFPRTREVKKKSEKTVENAGTWRKSTENDAFRNGFVLSGFAGRIIDHVDTFLRNCKEYFLLMY